MASPEGSESRKSVYCRWRQVTDVCTRREMCLFGCLKISWTYQFAIHLGHLRYFNNSGASVVDSAELMAEILHGSGKDHGAFRYEGKGYVRWDTFVSLTFLGQRDRHVYNGLSDRSKEAYITYHDPRRSHDSVDAAEGREDVAPSPSPAGFVLLDNDRNRGEIAVDVDTYRLPSTSDETTLHGSSSGRRLEGECRQTAQSEDRKHVHITEPFGRTGSTDVSSSSEFSTHVERRKGVPSVSPRHLSFSGNTKAETATPGSASQKTPRAIVPDEGEILSHLWASTEKAAAKARGKDHDHDEEYIFESPYSGKKSSLESPQSAGRYANGMTSGADAPAHQYVLASRTPGPSSKAHLASLPALCKKANQVRETVLEALRGMLPADCILLSGGLDTSILAESAALIRGGRFKVGITVCAGRSATDGPYAAGVAKRCGMEQILIGGGDRGDAVALLEQELDFVIHTLKTFDPMEVTLVILHRSFMLGLPCKELISSCIQFGFITFYGRSILIVAKR